MLIEGLHSHEPETLLKKHGIENSSKQLTTLKLKCKLCEVLKHHNHFYDFPSLVNFSIKSIKPERKTFAHILKHPTAYILTCANKGPPTLSA